jgi:hypothetical protein
MSRCAKDVKLNIGSISPFNVHRATRSTGHVRGCRLNSDHVLLLSCCSDLVSNRFGHLVCSFLDKGRWRREFLGKPTPSLWMLQWVSSKQWFYLVGVDAGTQTNKRDNNGLNLEPRLVGARKTVSKVQSWGSFEEKEDGELLPCLVWVCTLARGASLARRA